MVSPEQVREEIENLLIRDTLLSIATSDEWERLVKEGRLKKILHEIITSCKEITIIREAVQEVLESDEGRALIRNILHEMDPREGSDGSS